MSKILLFFHFSDKFQICIEFYYQNYSNFIITNLFLTKPGSCNDGTLFLVDCSADMFDQADGDLSLFQKSMQAIQNVYHNKIFGSDKDFSGILFFATQINNTNDDFENIYLFQDLSQPNAERIKQIESFTLDFDKNKFQDEYGCSENFQFDKVLWYCSNMFSSIKKKLDTKRILMFTRKSNPHRGNKFLEKLAKRKAADIADMGIVMEIIPLMNDGENFDYLEFYGDILMLTEEQIKLLPDAAVTFDQLENA